MGIFKSGLAPFACLLLSALVSQKISAQGPGQGLPREIVYRPQQLAQGRIDLVGGIPVLQVRGTPQEMGETAGILGLRQATGILEYPRNLARAFGAELLFPILLKTGEGMVKHFPPAYQEELRAIHKSSGAPWETLVAGNTMFDLKKFVLCSGIALEPGRTSFAKGTVLARNLDYPPVGQIHKYSLVTIYRPEGKRPFVSVGFPGLVGVLSGMNDAGLALAIHEVIDVKKGQKRFDAEGIPYALTYRMVLEECSTIEDAVNLLGRLKRTCTTNLLIADRKQVAVLEISPEKILKRPAMRGAVCCANHFCLAEHKPDEPLNPFDSFERQEFLEASQGQGALSIEQIRQSLDTVKLGRQTLQTMVFDTEALGLWVSFSGPPSSAGPLIRLDLANALKR